MIHDVIELQKSLYSATFSVATSMQKGCEEIMLDSLDMSPWLPKQGKNICLYWSGQYRTAMDNLQKASISQLEYMEKLLSPPQPVTPAPAQKQTKAKTAAAPKKAVAKPAAKAKSTKKSAAQTTRKAPAKKPATQKTAGKPAAAPKASESKGTGAATTTTEPLKSATAPVLPKEPKASEAAAPQKPVASQAKPGEKS